MGILRSVEWRTACPAEHADAAIRRVLSDLSMDPTGPPGEITSGSKGSLIKNRWPAKVSARLQRHASGAIVRWNVDMRGTKHFAILDDIAERLPEGTLDDRGTAEAAARLGLHRIFGRKEIRHLGNVLTGDEDVVALGQGVYAGNLAIVTLTTKRLFFLDRSIAATESFDEIPFDSVTSVSTAKALTGETLTIHTPGRSVEIKQMRHGNADEFARLLRQHREATQPADTAVPAPFAQIESLAILRGKGMISEDEFIQKKAELLGRI
ncbi:PH domain-containing protein [Actinoplanes couchii]|uniref:YokE-like PH domain-containing protein n=1 Tax=Actinoplanes couchii TaxID=403638 RepID=A0ABQ3XTZ6_9ACTN|nr:PH domain-containing protein [Actinoplanes couchii]MDR6319006.1 hypothetical protein [Actinoplanes couchii]GID61969.1 hypothetical protein Aco03nite_103730 [Actinoplanes couchii]